MSSTNEFVLTLTCPDRPGIVRDVVTFIAASDGNILDSAQYGDPDTGTFCMRIHFDVDATSDREATIRSGFEEVGERYAMNWELHDSAQPARVLIMVSRFDHCLADLLYRRRMGELKIDIPAVVSNHRDTYKLVANHDIPFFHLPVTPETKQQQEAKLMNLVEEEKIDFIVLARYMQILTPELCQRLRGRVINIHHSFLPGFKGARPYHQAHSRGVKLIGATAHYATADLDEGPIIEQDVARVTHADSPEELVAVGRDIERRVLARAVRYQSEHRVMLNQDKTVIF
ncbi:MAG: formyltetrahydrofolate deformylase [Xanthomonadales bacterium]|nr:formyltetrahydrofolate deformylase [Xanthomonadales bacterium]